MPRARFARVARATRAKLAQRCVCLFVCVCVGGEGITIIRRINKLGYPNVHVSCVYVSGLGRGGEERRIKTAMTRFTNGPVLKPTTRTEQKIKHCLIKNNLIFSKIYLKRCFPLYPTTEFLERKGGRGVQFIHEPN